MSGAPVLASLRCLSALPTGSAHNDHPGLGVLPDGAPNHDDLAGRVQPLHYQALLRRRVLSATARVRKRLAPQEAIALAGEQHTQARLGPARPEQGLRADGRALLAAQSLPVEPAGVAAAPSSRKRSAAEARLDAPSLPPVPCQPSSVHIASCSMSDDGTTPTAPAAEALPAEPSVGVSSEQIVEQRPLSPRATPHGAAQQPWRDGAQGGRGADLAPGGFLRPCDRSPQQGPSQPQHRGGRAQQQGAGWAAAGAAQAPQPQRGGGQAPGFGGMQPRALPPPQPGGGFHHGPTPVCGGILYPPAQLISQPQPHPQQGISQPQPHPQQGRHAGMQAGGQALQPACPPPQGGQGVPAQQPVVAPERQQPRGLCSLPAPSLELQQLLDRRGHGPAAAPGRGRKPLHARGEKPPQPQPQAVAPGPTGAGLLTALSSADKGVRAAVEQTVAAAAALQQEHLSALPAMARVLHSWPLDFLPAFFSSVDPPVDDRNREGDLGSGARGDAQPPPQLLSYVSTALPRRSAALELGRLPPQGALAPLVQALPLSVLSTPLPADSCQTRQDLWDLFLLHLQEQAQEGPQGQTTESIPSDGLAAAVGAALASAAASSQSPGSAGKRGAGSLAGQAVADPWAEAEVNGAAGSNDDSDVVITDEGLACLASLADAPRGASGWRLPFVVKPRQRPEGASADGCDSDGPAAPCPKHGDGEASGQRLDALQGRAPPPVLYFAGPFLDGHGLLQDSWSRLCTKALATQGAGGQRPDASHARAGEPVAAFGGPGACEEGRQAEQPTAAAAAAAEGEEEEPAAEAEEEEDCPHCQQDEWRLGGLSLLVLSHCRVGVGGVGCDGEGGAAAPLQVLALAAPGGAAGGQAAAQAAAVAAAAALQAPELACRMELLVPRAEAMAVVVDPARGRVLAQQRLDRGALMRLRSERDGESQATRLWRLAYKFLTALRRLPPGPYMLFMDAAKKVLELRG